MLKKIEILFRKFIFKLLIVLSSRKRGTSHPELKKINRVTFIRLNRIGDALVVTPIFSALKKYYNFQIVVLADRKNFFVFKNNPHIDEIITFQKGISGIKSAITVLNNSEIVVDLHDDVSTTVSYLIALCKSPYKFALKKENFNLFSHTISKPDPTESHVIDRVLKLLELFDLEKPVNANVEFYPSHDALETVSKKMNELNPEKIFHLGINISAGSDARFWGVNRYRELIREVLAKYNNIHITLLAAPGDIAAGEEISHELCSLYYSNSFEEFGAFISKLDLLFTPDTSTVHLASSSKIPMFGLYVKYNTNNKIWYPYKSNYDCVITEEPNFDNLDTDKVIPSFLAFFEKNYYEK